MPLSFNQNHVRYVVDEKLKWSVPLVNICSVRVRPGFNVRHPILCLLAGLLCVAGVIWIAQKNLNTTQHADLGHMIYPLRFAIIPFIGAGLLLWPLFQLRRMPWVTVRTKLHTHEFAVEDMTIEELSRIAKQIEERIDSTAEAG